MKAKIAFKNDFSQNSIQGVPLQVFIEYRYYFLYNIMIMKIIMHNKIK